MLSAILQKLSGSSASPPSPSVEGNTATTGGSGDILTSLLSNPELLSKLPTIIASIKPVIELLGKSGNVTGETVATSALPQKSEPLALETSKVTHSSDSRTALLCAMKPYLGEDRRQAIDYIVKLGRLGDILKTL